MLTIICAFAFTMLGGNSTLNAWESQSASGVLEITVAEFGSDRPVPCHVFLTGPDGKPVKPPGLPFWRDHFACPGSCKLNLPPGDYRYTIERGPEYRPSSGRATLPAGGKLRVKATIERTVNLAREGWLPGEMHVHRPLEDVPLLLQAADLHVAGAITWWNANSPWAQTQPPSSPQRTSDGRWYDPMGGEDEREGGTLLYFGLEKPLPIQSAARDYPSSVTFLEQARDDRKSKIQNPKSGGVWVDIEKPFWWDVPLWVALGRPDSIGIANNHMLRDGMYPNEAWGKPRDTKRLPDPLGNGFWSQEIYYRLLEAGVRLPPSAGSASGVLPNPVGYNRIYAHTGSDRSNSAWWKAVKAGNSFVTNGPLLRVRANGRLPGTVLHQSGGKALRVKLDIQLDCNDPIRAIEVVQNGKVVRQIASHGLPARIEVTDFVMDTPGWFLVRALADNDRTFRFASTSPFYVEANGAPTRISRGAVRFFLDWLNEREGRLKITDPAQRTEVKTYFDRASRWWQDRLSKATVN